MGRLSRIPGSRQWIWMGCVRSSEVHEGQAGTANLLGKQTRLFHPACLSRPCLLASANSTATPHCSSNCPAQIVSRTARRSESARTRAFAIHSPAITSPEIAVAVLPSAVSERAASKPGPSSRPTGSRDCDPAPTIQDAAGLSGRFAGLGSAPTQRTVAGHTPMWASRVTGE